MIARPTAPWLCSLARCRQYVAQGRWVSNTCCVIHADMSFTVATLAAKFLIFADRCVAVEQPSAIKSNRLCVIDRTHGEQCTLQL